jgi:probable rRNA maturation factor
MSSRPLIRRSRPVPKRTAPKRAAIILRIADPAWAEDKAVVALIRRSVRLALKTQPRFGTGTRRRGQPHSLAILLADDAQLRALNASFRGKNKPTNVLSFPASDGEPGYLGDIAMAYGTVRRESSTQAKLLAAHAAHLAAHGVLHLLGYDHEDASEARIMEALETALLAGLGIADPYAPRPYTPRRKAA